VGLGDVKYVVVPAGEIAVLPLANLAGLCRAPFCDDTKNLLNSVREKKVFCFLIYDPDEPLERLILLGHEIFHVLCALDPSILEKLDAMRGTFTKEQIVELFCDFAASWHFGPAYGKQFIEKIEFSPLIPPPSHPQRILRIVAILRALGRLNHYYVKEIRDFYNDRRNEISPSERQQTKDIVGDFPDLLESLGIERFKPEELKGEIATHFEKNVPYVYRDIRNMVNHLPETDMSNGKERLKLQTFLMESIRKTSMARVFVEKVKEKGGIYRLPKAFRSF
jgi:hypothetical protein